MKPFLAILTTESIQSSGPNVWPRWFAMDLARWLSLVSIAWCCLSNDCFGDRPNVLFIAVDDLRPELGCYGASHVLTPNIDRFASTALRFERAYCQQAVCNPSRTSLMTGLRPDRTGVTGNHSHFRETLPDVVTLPQHFINHGYHATAIGKLYHGVFPKGASITEWDTMGDPQSWSEPAIRFGPRYYYTERGIAEAKKEFMRVYPASNRARTEWTEKLVFGLATESPEVTDATLYDGKVASAAIDAIKRHGADTQQPFFLGVGFIKPHSPYIAPRRYFDLYKNVEVSSSNTLPAGAPTIAGHRSGELRRYTDQPKQGAISIEGQRRVRHAYYACVSFIDAQIGRVLGQLDQSGLSGCTIVCLYGDHGYHLGEHGLWGKTTNFELDTRVPLLIRVPGMKAAGASSRSLVELVDVYPTLAELAGLKVGPQLQGKSLAKLLDDPQVSVKDTAFSQYPRGGSMGYSVRTDAHRLTQWVNQDTGQVSATELYEYSGGDVETKNIAAENPGVVRRLANRLTHYVQTSGPDQIEALPGWDVVETRVETGFETQAAGPFSKLESTVGRWSVREGTAKIDSKYAATGNQCLHFLGGKKTVVELELSDAAVGNPRMSFRAERWTKRTPFGFRIQKWDSGEWSDLYDGDRTVVVGRPFKSSVSLSLGDTNVRRLRFLVTSPPHTGVMIDDLIFGPEAPQRIVSVETVPLTLPALANKPASALLKVNVKTAGSASPISVTEIAAGIDQQTSVNDVKSIQVYYTGADQSFSADTELGKPQKGLRNLKFEGNQPLLNGDNFFWVGCSLNENANIDRRVGAVCRSIGFLDGSRMEISDGESSQMMGISVRDGGDDGVHTYRIPGLATTKPGTLIAVYDVRRRSGGDLPGDIDVGMSRSTDGGRTWEPMKIIVDMGNDPEFRFDGVGDPAVLVDAVTGTIWCAATWSHGNRSWVGSGPGFRPDETGQFILVKSDDDGLTWSDPINITKQVKRPEWSFLLQGPGKGISLSNGTIAFAAQFQDPPSSRDPKANRLPHSAMIFSADHGESWRISDAAFDDTTESQIVELEDGQIMINCRYNRESKRVVMTSDDMGTHWSEHPTSRKSLIEPGSCMASLINVGRELRAMGQGGAVASRNDILLFSNPNSTRGRNHISIKASLDGGKTWPLKRQILLDQGNGRGYSCLSMIDSDTVGILYESSQSDLTFQRLKIADILAPPDNHRPTRVQAFDNGQTFIGPPNLGMPDQLSLGRPFTDHMVLQADRPIRIWGNAVPGARIDISLGTSVKAEPVHADPIGRWSVELAKQSSNSNPQILRAESNGHVLEVADVLIGEVWYCAGQSNMEWPVSKNSGGDELVAESSDPLFRILNFRGGARGSSGVYGEKDFRRLHADAFCEGTWAQSGPTSIGSFSAAAYFFGRRLRKSLDVPVGVINVSIGGTPIESWVGQARLMSNPDLAELVDGNWMRNPKLDDWCKGRARVNLGRGLAGQVSMPGDQWGPNHSFKPGFMYEAAVRPFETLSVRGVLWYQGESNGDSGERIEVYDACFPELVNQWRSVFKDSALPVGFVQLPALDRRHWPEFREFQRRSLDRIEHAGMAVTIDTGDPMNVHPPQKQPVGERLARWALVDVYGSRGPPMGPLYRSIRRDSERLIVQFTHAKGMKTADGKPPRHFEIAGADGRFNTADARIDGDQVVLSSEQVPLPTEVRYAWKAFPVPSVNLVNGIGLPASPFTSQETFDAHESVGGKRVSLQADSIATNRRSTPNVLLIVSEDNGSELGCYGDPYAKTPNLDALADQGVRFETAYVTQSVCSPSRGSILTGLYPHQHGQIGLATHQFEMFGSRPTTYSILKASGYRTGMIGKLHVNPERMFEDQIDFRAIKSSNFSKKNLADYARKSSDFFNASDRPFFLTVNFPDAHWPVQNRVQGRPESLLGLDDVRPMSFIGIDNPRIRNHVKGYYNCMTRLDECVGELLEALKRSGNSENTIVIYVGDHGAQFSRGKVFVTEGGLRIPFIVRWPGHAKEGHTSQQMVSTIDLLPTIARAIGADLPSGLPGIDLAGPIAGNESSGRHYLFAERNTDAASLHYPQRAVRDKRYKLIKTLLPGTTDPAAKHYLDNGASNFRGSPTFTELEGAPEQIQGVYREWLNPPEFQLYDLENDPNEFVNLADVPEYRIHKERLVSRLERWQSETDDSLADTKLLGRLTAEVQSCLGSGIRSPIGGWDYVNYLEPPSESSHSCTVYQHRTIPTGVPLNGHAKDAKQYAYRIPSLLSTKHGSVLAFSERRIGLHDHAQNDIVVKRSVDGGTSWGREIVVFEDGMNSINDPLTVQLDSGRILAMFSRFPYGRHTRNSGWITEADLGYDDPNANVQSLLCHSDDDGLTWSEPVDISRQVKHPNLLNANTPGAMIQLSQGPHKGRVITGLWGAFPSQSGKREFAVVVAYSDDRGQTWKRTEPLIDKSGKGFPNECQIAEASNGDLVLVSRNQGGEAFRKKAFSHDGGETWTEIAVDKGLPSVACMGSLVRGPMKPDGGWDLWASFPSDQGRKNGQIVVSRDNGLTWGVVQVIEGPFAYSALQVSMDGKELFCLYESDQYRTQTFLKLPIR